VGGPDFVIGTDGIRFLARKTPYRQILEIPEYRFDDIRPEDRVLDIGANVGAFSLRAAQKTPLVTAVEPVTASILTENIRINNAAVRVIEGGLGPGTPARCTWDEESRLVATYPLGTLTRMAGGCDFLKCDCEGAEWQIQPSELEGIRRIEMELHLPPICPSPDMSLLDYISRHFDFEIERKPCHDVLGVMGILHAERH
jgi:FkbM family methyltransferase